MRKARAINKSENDKKKILEMFEEKHFKPAQIYQYFEGKYSYWQIYNTISPRTAKSDTVIKKDGTVKEKKLKASSLISEMPDVDLSDFQSIEKFTEHQLTVISSQLNDKNIRLDRRIFLVDKLVKINKNLKQQLLEGHLKNATARLVIRIMRRLKPELSDDEIMNIFKEESEILKKLNK